MVRIPKYKKIDNVLKSMNKHPRNWKMMELTFLLRDEAITEQNVLHCLENKDVECHCRIHDGRFKQGIYQKSVYFIEVWLRGEGKLDRFCIPTRRKGDVMTSLENTIHYEYDIAQEELRDLIMLRKIISFDNEEVGLLEDLQDAIHEMRHDVENLAEVCVNDDDIIHIPKNHKDRLTLLRNRLSEIILKIKPNKIKITNCINVLELLDELIKSETITSQKMWRFIDDGDLDLEWYSQE